MTILQLDVSGEVLPFGAVSYWRLTGAGISIATLATATYAMLSIADSEFQPALFDLPAQLSELKATIGVLRHVFQLGRDHRNAEALRKLGVGLADIPRLAKSFQPPLEPKANGRCEHG